MANATIEQLLQILVERRGSDLHLSAGSPPRIRIDGDLIATEHDILNPDACKRLIYSFLSGDQVARFEKDLEIDLSFGVEGLGRFRTNVFFQRGTVSAVLRMIPYQIRGFEELGLPGKICEEICALPRGLVLVTGATGSGKSTTLAAMVDHVNAARALHIVTVEDPIEFLHRNKSCLVNQREIGADSTSFKRALRSALRQDPDVVLVGEMRDKETFEAALNAAETGHLVYGTIHASSTTQTFSRIYGLFEVDEREQVRKMLAYQMRAFVYQKLLPTLHEHIHRIPALEVLLNNIVVQKHILDGREGELREYLKSIEAVQTGMKDFNQSLVELVEGEMIHVRTALEASPNVDELQMRLKKLG
jgi:twitching motility protein PilT